jgi:hypothetical protein
MRGFDGVQEVRLVLVQVARLEQGGLLVTQLESRVVTGGEALCAEPPGVVEAYTELDLAVAQHVRVRRAAGAIFGEEVFEHARAVGLREAYAVQRHAELGGGGARILEVLRRRAVVVVFLPVAHVEPVDVEAGALQQQRRDGGVHAAGHADDDPLGRFSR